MKKTLFLLHFIAAFLLFSTTSYCQLNWAWAKDGGSNGNGNMALDITADAQGNSYVTGYVSPGCVVNGQTVPVVDSYDVFVAKYDVNGNQVWIRTAGGIYGDVGKRIKVDNNGNLYLCGIFTDTATFDNIQVTENKLGFFIAKMDTAGNFIWVKPGILGIWPYHQQLFGLDLDAAGNIYYAGPARCQSTVIGNITTFGNTIPGSHAPMVIKFDPNGNILWHYVKPNNWQGAGIGTGANIKVDRQGNVVLVNSCSRTDTSTSNWVTMNNLLILKFNPTGQFLWKREYDSVTVDWSGIPNSLDFDDDNNMYIGGTAYRTFWFDSNLPSCNPSGFLAKFTPNGSLVWARKMENVISNQTTAIRSIRHFQYSDSMYCAGYYLGSVDFDGIPLSSSNNNIKMFVVSYDTTGSVKWLLTYGNNFYNNQNFWAATFSGKAYLVAGFYTSSIAFGPVSLATSGTSYMEHNFFLASTHNMQALETPDILSSSGMNFSLYPNPASTSVTVQIDDKNKTYDLSVYSNTGQSVFSQSNVKSSTTINTSTMASGNYFIQVNRNGQTLTKRFVVNH
ncbi:MAG TPA: T9SS type A sorting domain-containing protein [Flavipsychrobacter sp.]|nr:T9SS type A sorting domain-containing protein [Flavipsychrobacter sp.]